MQIFKLIAYLKVKLLGEGTRLSKKFPPNVSFALVFAAFMFFGLVQSKAGGVVINEIMFRAPGDLTELEYVELWNYSDKPVAIGGWSIKGIGLEITADYTLEPNGFYVACRNAELFERIYQQKPDAVYGKSLSNGGERLTLLNAEGNSVETVKYDDKAPWPDSADGKSASLERISPEHDSDYSYNWAPSSLTASFDTAPSGTPGKINTTFQKSSPPVIKQIGSVPSVLESGDEIQLSAEVHGEADKLEALVAMIEPGKAPLESSIEMTPDGDGIYQGSIPAQVSNRIIRYRFKATGQDGTTGWLPHPNELRPSYSSYVQGDLPDTEIPVMHFISTSESVSSNFASYRTQRGRRFGPSGFGFGRPQAESAEDILRRNLSRRVNNDGLKSQFAQLTLGKKFSIDQLLELSKAFRVANRALTGLNGEINQAKDLPAFEVKFDARLKQILEALADACRSHITAENAQILSELFNQNRDDRISRSFDPNRFIHAIFDIESAWFAHCVQQELTAAQVEALSHPFTDALKQREALLADLHKQGTEPDLPVIMGGVREASMALNEKIRSIVGEAEPQSRPVRTEREDPRGRREGFGRGPGRGFGRNEVASPVPSQGESALVYREAGSDEVQFFDYVNILPRKSGYKVRFQKDRSLNGMTTLNVLFESGDATTVNEILAYPTYELFGNITVASGATHVLMDGEAVGYHLWFEQPNGSFLKRRNLNSNGNLYKVIWQQSNRPSPFTPKSKRTNRDDIVARWEKVTQPHDGYADLVKMIESLENAEGNDAAMWDAIETYFEVDQVINYYAANLLISHWDGFFNNYFLYHDVDDSGKWSLLPWDQDSTWSLRGGSPDTLSKMPLNYGGEGARPPGSSSQEEGRSRFGGRGFGSGFGWWRDGDVISKSLIGNPTFFAQYKERIRTLLETTFKPEVFDPLFEDLKIKLIPEIELRAQLNDMDPASEAQRLENIFNTLSEHLEKRREFLLSELVQ
jgi:hypothetical protein